MPRAMALSGESVEPAIQLAPSAAAHMLALSVQDLDT